MERNRVAEPDASDLTRSFQDLEPWEWEGECFAPANKEEIDSLVHPVASAARASGKAGALRGSEAVRSAAQTERERVAAELLNSLAPTMALAKAPSSKGAAKEAAPISKASSRKGGSQGADKPVETKKGNKFVEGMKPGDGKAKMREGGAVAKRKQSTLATPLRPTETSEPSVRHLGLAHYKLLSTSIPSPPLSLPLLHLLSTLTIPINTTVSRAAIGSGDR